MWVFHRPLFVGFPEAPNAFICPKWAQRLWTLLHSHSNSLHFDWATLQIEGEKWARAASCSFVHFFPSLLSEDTSGTAEDGSRFSALWVLRRISAYHINFSTCRPTPDPPFIFRCALISRGTRSRRRMDQIEKVSLAKDSAICNSDAVLQTWKLISPHKNIIRLHYQNMRVDHPSFKLV